MQPIVSENKSQSQIAQCERPLGRVYTKRQSQFASTMQRCDDACGTVPLATMEWLENAVATRFAVTPLWSMRTVSQASSQRHCSDDAN